MNIDENKKDSFANDNTKENKKYEKIENERRMKLKEILKNSEHINEYLRNKKK